MVKGMVSVIIPVYNCEKYLEDCVENLLSQTYKNIEIILVNDGSTDRSASIGKQIAENNCVVQYLSQSNSGTSVARNNGLDHADGEFIMFVDADDGVKADIIQRLLDKMDDTTDIVCCSYEILETNQNEDMFSCDFQASNPIEKASFYKQLMDVTYGHLNSNATAIGVPWAKLYRKSIFDDNNLRFDSELRRMQDNVMIMEAFCYARKVTYINEYLYSYRIDHINSYNSYTYSDQVYLGVLKKRHEFFEQHPEYLTEDVFGYYYYEHINYLMMSIHYITAQKEKTRKQKLESIKNLCKNPIYSEVLDKKIDSVISKKQQIQCFMYRHNMYTALYEFYRIKYKL